MKKIEAAQDRLEKVENRLLKGFTRESFFDRLDNEKR